MSDGDQSDPAIVSVEQQLTRAMASPDVMQRAIRVHRSFGRMARQEADTWREVVFSADSLADGVRIAARDKMDLAITAAQWHETRAKHIAAALNRAAVN